MVNIVIYSSIGLVRNMNTTNTKQAQEFAEINGLSEEINQAYIDNVGAEYATAADVEETYIGDFSNDEEFAQEEAEALTEMPTKRHWPFDCIDWEWAARELMNDYFEADGHYFRIL